MARANPNHASRLISVLMEQHFSTRELFDFFQHYQHSNRRVRENMIDEPALFVKAREAGKDLNEARELTQGPEGKFRKDLSIIGHMVKGLLRAADTVIYPGQSNMDRRSLLTAFHDADQIWCELQKKIERYTNDTDSRQRDDFSVAQSPCGHSSDQQTA